MIIYYIKYIAYQIYSNITCHEADDDCIISNKLKLAIPTRRLVSFIL
jgi:hypothetical protein